MTDTSGVHYVEAWRCRVESDDDPDKTYFVDLAALPMNGKSYNFRNGECDCPHFQMRLKPIIVKGHHNGLPHRCKHIIRARHWFLDHAIERDAAEKESAQERFDRHANYTRHEFDRPQKRIYELR